MSRFPGSYLYVLDGRTPVPCDDVHKWGEWMQTGNCRVAETVVGGLIRISTVFLGVDHSFFADDEPDLFECMVFGADPDDRYQERCATWEQAEEMHARAVTFAETCFKRGELTAGWLEPAMKLLRASREEDATAPAAPPPPASRESSG